MFQGTGYNGNHPERLRKSWQISPRIFGPWSALETFTLRLASHRLTLVVMQSHTIKFCLTEKKNSRLNKGKALERDF